jgi:hypothetical protein
VRSSVGSTLVGVGKGKRTREARQAAREQAAEARRNERPFPDPRLWTTEVKEIGGKPVSEPTYIFPVDRLRLDDGRVLAFHAATLPGFYLVTAKELRDAGERVRQEVLAATRDALEREDWADVNVSDDSLALDALGKLFSAVILSAAAVEAYANEAVDRLPDGTIIERRRGKETQQIPKEEAIRRLGLDEKLHLVLPIVTGVESSKGKKPWEAFARLNELRGEIVHYKPRGKTDDPDIASALGRLLKGEAATCVEDAASVVLAYEANALPESTKQALTCSHHDEGLSGGHSILCSISR